MDEFMLCCKVISSLTEKYTAIAQTIMQTPDNTMSLNYLNAQFAMEDARQKIAGSTGTGKSGEGKGQALQTGDKDKNKDKEIIVLDVKRKDIVLKIAMQNFQMILKVVVKAVVKVMDKAVDKPVDAVAEMVEVMENLNLPMKPMEKISSL